VRGLWWCGGLTEYEPGVQAAHLGSRDPRLQGTASNGRECGQVGGQARGGGRGDDDVGDRLGGMALPPLIRRLLDVKLAAWCDARVPEHIRDELRYEHGIRGNSATLFEVRPYWDGRPGETRQPFAQIRLKDDVFVLYCSDRNGRWHEFTPFVPSPDLDDVLAEIEEDRTCIFFG